MTINNSAVCVVILCAIVSSCVQRDKMTYVELYVSNQSFADPDVDISVQINDICVVNESFNVGGQHSYEKYVVGTKMGRNVIYVHSKGRSLSLSKEIVIDHPVYIIVQYWYYPPEHYDPTPRKISISVLDKPPKFM